MVVYTSEFSTNKGMEYDDLPSDLLRLVAQEEKQILPYQEVTCKEIEARIQIPYTTIQIPESGVMKNKARRFESSRYGFESLSKGEG